MEDMQVSADMFEVSGEVIETLPNMTFRVRLDDSNPDMAGKLILCTLSGKMKMYRIKVMLGDKVKALVSKYDLSKGRITLRLT